MEALKAFLDTPAGGVAAFAVGALATLVVYLIRRRVIADRAYAGQVAHVEANLGFSTLWTQPLVTFSNGDMLGTVKALKAKFDHFKDPTALATELTSVFQKQYSTNTAFAKSVDAFLGDIKSGNATAALADVKAAAAAVPGLTDLGLPPAIADFQHLAQVADSLANNPQLKALHDALESLPAALKGPAMQIASAAAAASAPVAAPAVAAATLPTVPDGHTVTIENTGAAK